MIEIDDKLVSLEIFEKKFVCDLNACKGACCVEGDAGAPLKKEEIDLINENIEGIKKHMRLEGIDAINNEGIWYYDTEKTPVTTLINQKECAFTYFDEDGTAKCGIEKAHLNGDSSFKKPISCYLYPIRVKQMKFYDALNYDEWDICKPACSCGDKLNVSVFRFLKQPLITAYGEDFYKKLEIVDRELQKSK